MVNERLINAYQRAQNHRNAVFGRYDEIARYTMPYFSIWDNKSASVSSKSTDCNSTVLSSVTDHVNFLVSGLLTGGNFASLELDKGLYEKENDVMSKKILKNFDTLSDDLEEDADRVFNIIDSSNFTSEVIKAFSESSSLGTGCVKMIIKESDANPVKFKYISVKSLCFSEDQNGIDTVFVEINKMCLKELRKLFNDKTIKVPGVEDEDEKINLVEVVEKVGKDEYEVSLYTAGLECKVKTMQTLEFNPYVIFRSDYFTNNVFGKGIGFNLIDTFRRLEYYNKLQRSSAEQNIFPSSTFFGDVNHFNKLDFNAGAHNYGGASRDQFAIEFNPTVGNYLGLQEEINKAEYEIRSAYMSNPIGDYTDRAQTTASEIQQRMQLFRDRFAITYSLLSEELLKVVFFSVYKILFVKKLNKFDAELIDMINIRYTNQLSKATDKAKANDLIFYKRTMMETAQQTELIQIDQVKYGETLGKLLDVDGDLYKSSEEIEKKVAQVEDNYVENSNAQQLATKESAFRSSVNGTSTAGQTTDEI